MSTEMVARLSQAEAFFMPITQTESLYPTLRF
jgi:hypothetical protein